MPQQQKPQQQKPQEPRPALPIEAVLPELLARLRQGHEAVLVAAPGAGKTTRVPLALLAEPWLGDRKILVLEPRRIATRSAAHHMAGLLGETPGGTVGYRMRLETRVGADTRIEVISEGILTRMLQQDPSLADVAVVIFDEFHERNIDADLALTLCLHGRALFRDASDPLKLLVMSATLDSVAVAGMLGDAPVVRSDGRQYPVDLVYGAPAQAREALVPRTVATVLQALAEHPAGSVLVFLPGQGEIRRCAELLQQRLQDLGLDQVQLHPLYGQLSMDEQQRAIAPVAKPGWRKVVIATNIAETSLTIDGIHLVVDAGVARTPVFDPATGMTRLQVQRISKAAASQRAGRAGRLGPGHCYRLWSQDQQQLLQEQMAPEILNADLAPLALQLLQWGVADPEELQWLDPPPPGPWQQALDLLERLGAVDHSAGQPALSGHGRQLAELPLHPRLGHLLLTGRALGCAEQGCQLAAVLADGQNMDQPDLAVAVAMVAGSLPGANSQRQWLRRTRELARRFAAQIQQRGKAAQPALLAEHQVLGCLLASAYPDRIAQRRGKGGYQLANGRSAALVVDSGLSNVAWLAVADASGNAGGRADSIRSAAVLDPALFAGQLEHLVSTERVAAWDARAGRFVAEERSCIGALVLRQRPLAEVPAQAKQEALLQLVRSQGLALLPWSPRLRQWQARVQLLHQLNPEWPDVSDAGLLASLEDWLGPWLEPITSLAGFRKLKLAEILRARLPWALAAQLEQLAPERLQVPSGSSLTLDYSQTPPVLAVKLQEMFGCEDTPRVANNQVPVMVHLLSPAGRPLQITQDLAGFWRSSYQDVRREMRGRYPKHPWPEDPLVATATKRTKGQGGKKRSGPG